MVDNASDDGTAALLEAHPSNPRVLRLPGNAGYAGAMAVALDHVETPLMAWLNDDAAPAPTWLATLEDGLEKAPLAAAATSRLERADGSVQSMGVRLTADGHGADLTESPEVFGAWRLRLAGWDVVAVPEARVRHAHGASTNPGSELFHLWNERNRLLTLLRCAPAGVAVRQLIKFAVLTALLPLRPGKPDAANFRVRLRVRVLTQVAARLPAALAARRRITRFGTLSRGAVWDAWAGL